jgi:hypothetical protein
MQLRLVFVAPVVRIKHHRRNVTVVPFRADEASLQYRHGISNHNGTDVAYTENFERGFNRRHWYDPVSGMRQDGVTDWSQHPLCGNRKDCWTHIVIPSTNLYLVVLVV